MFNIAVTGADGFIGAHLFAALSELPYMDTIFKIKHTDDPGHIQWVLDQVDAVFHLAGVNRPKNKDEFISGNEGFTRQLLDMLLDGINPSKRPFFYLASTEQLNEFSNDSNCYEDNIYAHSKMCAEYALYEKRNILYHVRARLPHVFGPGCKPHYNSVIATFCHNATQGVSGVADNPNKCIKIVHIHYVIQNALDCLADYRAFMRKDPYAFVPDIPDDINSSRGCALYWGETSGAVTVSLQEIVDTINACAKVRDGGQLPDVSVPWIRDMYSTFLSYVPELEYMYVPKLITDGRGSLVQILGSENIGQWYIVTLNKDVVRGDHYHKRKVEKFIVLQGDVTIELNHIDKPELCRSFVMVAPCYRVVDVPPDYMHRLINNGRGLATVLCWASEPFDKNNQDTYRSQDQCY